MKIVFIGAVRFSLECLKRIIQDGVQVTLVVSTHIGVGQSDHVDLSEYCAYMDIPLHLTVDVNSKETVSKIKNAGPDYIFCLGWHQLIRAELLQVAPNGIIGYHPSLLPENRGRHPLIWALVLGLKETGSSFFYMDEGPDTGDIISQKILPIYEDDDAEMLYSRMIKTAVNQLSEVLMCMQQGFVERKKQDLSYGNTWRKRSSIDGKIDWRMTSDAIINLVRALTHPYVGAHATYKGKDCKVWRVEKSKNIAPVNVEPGKILAIGKSNILEVKTGNGVIAVTKHELPNSIEIGDYLI